MSSFAPIVIELALIIVDRVFFQGYEIFGLNAQPNGDIKYREWAPNAVEASLVGDFSMCF